MFLRRCIAIDLGRMVEHLDADLDRARMALADARLKTHVEFLRARVIEFAHLLELKCRLASERFAEGLMARLFSNPVSSRERNPVGYGDQRRCMPKTHAANLLGDGVER